MTTYADSSAIVATYVTQAFSTTARRHIRRARQLPYTSLHELEVQNAFELLHGRRELSTHERDAILEHLQRDLLARRLDRVDVNWPEVFAAARELSTAHSARLHTRSLDLLHVASARTARCRVFVSADDRQLALARAAKLKVIDVKRG